MKAFFAAMLMASSTAHACLPTQAGGTGTEYRVAEKNGNTVAVWLCGKTWEWVGAPAIGMGLDKRKGKELSDMLTTLRVQRDHARDPAEFWPAAKALIESTGRKVEGVQA